MIYFDNNATTPIDTAVVEAMQPFLTTFHGNPSSLHRHGRVVKTAVEQARQQVADLVKVNPDQVVFTSGGTEANNLCIASASSSKKHHILFGATEHPSVSEPIRQLSSSGFIIDELPVNKEGGLNEEVLKNSLRAETGFISVMHANNETGVIQDIAPLASLAQEKGVIFHTDAVQSIGKMAVEFNSLNVNLMSVSGHKIYGPKGVGAIIHDKKTPLEPLFYGGGQENQIRPGTENVASIVGFGQAAQLASELLEERSKHLLGLQKSLEQGISNISGLTIVSSEAERLPNTSQILLDSVDGEMLLMQLDQRGVAVSSGSACSSQSKAPSPVLKAMCVPDKLALIAIRVSLGQQNTLQEVSDFVSILKEIVA